MDRRDENRRAPVAALAAETLKAPWLAGHRGALTSQLFLGGKALAGILVDLGLVPDGFSLQAFHVELVIVDQRAAVGGAEGDQRAGENGQDQREKIRGSLAEPSKTDDNIDND